MRPTALKGPRPPPARLLDKMMDQQIGCTFPAETPRDHQQVALDEAERLARQALPNVAD